MVSTSASSFQDEPVADEISIADDLLCWWDQHGRKDLPWQINRTPYRVWVSEIMLQQTQVKTVERYYARFMQEFPNVIALADAEQDRVLHLWSGLGYYARARNMHRAAITLRDEFAGVFPDNLEALQALPGIGRSTAGAILALSQNLRHPILDGNVKRVLARHRGVAGWPGTTAVSKVLWSWAEQLTPYERVADYTQAIMDLGATLCTRRNPQCSNCPLHNDCQARLTDRVSELPTPKPKPQQARPQRAVIVLLVTNDQNEVLLEKRDAAGIWGGLWGLPEVTTEQQIADYCLQTVGCCPEQVFTQPPVAHSFSHFDLTMTPVVVKVKQPDCRLMEAERWLWYNMRAPAQVGLAAPVSRILKSIGE